MSRTNDEPADSSPLLLQSSLPGFFLEQPDSILTKVMDTDYWTACWTAKASATLMAKQHLSYPSSRASRPKLVFVGSTLSFLNFAGYSSYCPPKAAVRSLADTLRNELQLFGIEVHTFFPAGILSPGFENENLEKPQLTKDIEGSDVPLPPMEVAKYLLKGTYDCRAGSSGRQDADRSTCLWDRQACADTSTRSATTL